MAAIRVVGSIRDWINARDVRRMTHRQAFPESLVRHYLDRAEYGKDEAALLAIGYMTVAKDETPTHVGVTLPASSNGVTGHLDRRIQRRVASIHVTYRRRSAPTPRANDPAAETTPSNAQQ
jgi:hypothetical protein